jgi:lysophospholipase L1-like esterase
MLRRRHFVALSFVTLVSISCSADDKVRVACVGDSITYGAGIEKRTQYSYPAVLQKLLGDKYEVRNFGVSGSTLMKNGDKPYVKEKAFADVKKFNPNIVIIILGSNDTKPQNWKQIEDYVADYKSLVGEFQALDPKPKVCVCYPVPAYNEAFGINDGRVKELKPKIDAVAKDLGLPVIDLYTALSEKKEMFPDGVHPNAAGATLIAETVHKALIEKK